MSTGQRAAATRHLGQRYLPPARIAPPAAPGARAPRCASGRPVRSRPPAGTSQRRRPTPPAPPTPTATPEAFAQILARPPALWPCCARPLVFHPLVDCQIQQVDPEIDQNIKRGDNDQRAFYHRIITPQHGVHHKIPIRGMLNTRSVTIASETNSAKVRPTTVMIGMAAFFIAWRCTTRASPMHLDGAMRT